MDDLFKAFLWCLFSRLKCCIIYRFLICVSSRWLLLRPIGLLYLAIVFEVCQEIKRNLTNITHLFSALSITMQVAGAALLPHNKPMLETPCILSEISPGFSKAYGVSYFDNETICTRGDACIIKIFNLQGSLTESIKIPSGNLET